MRSTPSPTGALALSGASKQEKETPRISARSIEHLREYVYRSAHVEVLRNRHEWFSKFEASYLALWWVPVGHGPSVDEAKKRLAYLADNGPTSFAFTFKVTFPPDPTVVQATDWSAFEPCPAV
jgi:hypothetical protein